MLDDAVNWLQSYTLNQLRKSSDNYPTIISTTTILAAAVLRSRTANHTCKHSDTTSRNWMSSAPIPLPISEVIGLLILGN